MEEEARDIEAEFPPTVEAKKWENMRIEEKRPLTTQVVGKRLITCRNTRFCVTVLS
jgi:hypothetical protein